MASLAYTRIHTCRPSGSISMVFKRHPLKCFSSFTLFYKLFSCNTILPAMRQISNVASHLKTRACQLSSWNQPWRLPSPNFSVLHVRRVQVALVLWLPLAEENLRIIPIEETVVSVEVVGVPVDQHRQRRAAPQSPLGCAPTTCHVNYQQARPVGQNKIQ